MRRFMAIPLIAVLLLVASPSRADDPTPILGNWTTETDMNGRKNESTMEFKLIDGKLTATSKGRRGQIDAFDVKYEKGVLSWKISIQGNAIPIEVTVTGDTFEGAAVSPLGRLPMTGKRVNPEAEAANDKALRAMVGDWTLQTTYGGKQFESKMRIYVADDDDIEASIILPGSNVVVRRVQYNDGTLRFPVAMPFVSDEPANVVAKVVENRFEGTVKSAFGDIPITGELVDTTKLVVAPYDPPTAILGKWTVHAVLRDKEQDGALSFSEDGPKLLASLQLGDATYECTNVSFSKVSDAMSVARITVAIPGTGDKPLVFELAVNGDAFEGEELYSNGALVLTGSRSKT
jgi:hypothetical protein